MKFGLAAALAIAAAGQVLYQVMQKVVSHGAGADRYGRLCRTPERVQSGGVLLCLGGIWLLSRQPTP
jgi:hypothetical protein